MPRFIPQDDGSFQMEMTEGDAQEAHITEAIKIIIRMAKSLEGKPHDAAARAKDRGGYWRYAEIERTLNIIRGQADDALRHIKFLDFPELVKPEGTA